MSIRRLFNHTTKFWEISLEDGSATTTVRFGKLGTNGQTRPKEHGSPEDAVKFVEKMVNEKVKEGYVEEGTEGASEAAKDVEVEEGGEEETKKRGRGKAETEPAAKKPRGSKKDAEPEPEADQQTERDEPEAPNRSQALHNLLSAFDFSDMTKETDPRISVVESFAGDNVFVYWDEAEGKHIFKPDLKAWSFGVVYLPAQFGWLQELQQKEKAGETVTPPEGYSESDLESLQRDLAYLSTVSTTIKPCTAAMGSETDYPFLPVILSTPSLDAKAVFTALGVHEKVLKRVQDTDLSTQDLEKWYEDRILSRESYEEGSAEFTEKKEAWNGLWEMLKEIKEKGLRCMLVGEMECNPCPVVIGAWSGEEKRRVVGVFSGVVYT